MARKSKKSDLEEVRSKSRKTAETAARILRVGRGSDQFIVRFPPGMRDTIAAAAEGNGRSMNAEIVARLEFSLEGREMLSEHGLTAMSKRFLAAADALEGLFFDVRDMDLEGFIVEMRREGKNLTRTEAIRHILREYLSERGFIMKKERTDKNDGSE